MTGALASAAPPRPYIPQSGERAARGPQFPRTRVQRLRIWWREIDRTTLALILVLMLFGAVAVAAASPSSARRLKVDDLHFFYLDLVFQALGLGVLFVTSLMPREFLRRAVTLGGLGMLLLVEMDTKAQMPINRPRPQTGGSTLSQTLGQ